MKTKAYSYVRFSTGDQIKGDSLRRQTETTRQWCQKHEVDLVESYRDLGVSAFKGKNAEMGALSQFLNLARNGKIEKGSYLIVESLDRISRNAILDAFQLFLDIIRAGVVVVTLSDGHIYDKSKINDGNFTDLIISLTVLSRANEESRTKSQRISAAWNTKRKHIGETKLTGKCVAWLKLDDDRKHFQPIPERVQVVRRIFDMATKGHGANSITKTLQREEVKPFGRGCAWFTSYVKKILDNRAVIGEFVPATMRNGKREFLEPIPNYYPPVIDKKVFATVHQIRKARPSYVGRSSFNVFSRLAFDRVTNTPMTYVNKNRDKGWHYLVPAAALRQQAEYCTWQYDEFLAAFLTVCQKAALTKPPTMKRNDGDLDLARMELVEVEKQINRLVDFLARGRSSGVEMKLRELETEKKAVQERVVELENQIEARPADVAKVNWKDVAALRENLRATVKRITVDAPRKWFQANFLDGRVYTFFVRGDDVVITTPDAPGEWLPEGNQHNLSPK